MTAPLTLADRLLASYGPRLDDRSEPLSEIELKRIEREITAALESAPAAGRAALYSLRGSCLKRRNRPSDALAEYQKAARLDQHNAVYANNLGTIFIDSGDLDQAERWIREASDRPTQPSGLGLVLSLNRAEIHRRRGRAELANSAFEDAIAKSDPLNAREHFSLAFTASLLGRQSDATEFFARHVALRTGDVLDERHAADFLRDHPGDLEACAVTAPDLARALRAALAEDVESAVNQSAPVTVELTPAAWDRLTDLLEHPPEPSAALRKVLRERRG